MPLRNSLHRRNHKERSQLAHRARLGILEKHKDYVQRARDFHSKQDRLKRLRERAAQRNRDEFYFGMVKGRTESGVHVQDRGNATLPTDMVKVLKSQDGNYIRAVRQAGLKKIDKLKEQLGRLADLTTPGRVGDDGAPEGDNEGAEDLDMLADSGVLASLGPKGQRRPRARHVVFVANPREAEEYKLAHTGSSRLPTQGDDDQAQDISDDLGWEWPGRRTSQQTTNRSLKAVVAARQSEEWSTAQKEGAATHRRQLLTELAARIKRDKNLWYAGRELEMQRLIMGKGAARRIRGVEKVEGGDEKDEDEDVLDAAAGRRKRKVDVGMEEVIYKPRVYKWRAERKK